MSTIWPDSLLNQLSTDAETDINKDLSCLFHRFYLATVASTAVYRLPAKVIGVKKITWRGVNVDPLSWADLSEISFNSYWVDGTVNLVHVGIPRFYAFHPTNRRDIVFYPGPNESLLDTGGDPYSPVTNEARCTITCWRTPDLTDPNASLPPYIDRRTRKAYVLWKAFAQEGRGQNLAASQYFKKRLDFLMSSFRNINDSVYLSRKYQMWDSLTGLRNTRPAKPSLPSNFERVTF